MKRSHFFPLALAAVLASCGREPSHLLQGYIEGEYVYVSAPLGGKLEKLNVQRGAQVKAGELLFALEDVAEKAARDETAQRLQQAQATLEDARKGRRPSEIEALRAGVMLVQDALALSKTELDRQEELRKTGAVAVESFDKARSIFFQDQHRVEQLQADLKTATLGLRSDAVAALEADVKARAAALTKAEWDLSQKQQKAPQAGLIQDTLYREGEFVATGRPIVSLLPPANVKVRAFVPQDQLWTVQGGATAVNVYLDGVPEALRARVSFISPQAEYTPPVIYSRENRSKLVFMVELRFDDADAVKLHPGQPVDVEFMPLP